VATYRSRCGGSTAAECREERGAATAPSAARARQAEAEREKRAKIIHAEGELIASEKLSQAAAVLGRETGAMTLRYLQTLNEIAAEQNSTIVFPLPMDLLPLLRKET